MAYVEITILSFILCLLILAYRKIRMIHISTYELMDKIGDVEIESKHLYGQIQAYIDLKALLALTQPLPRLRGWAASPDFLVEIAKHALKEKPNCIVECSSGASTIVLARCAQLSNTGHVFSLEHDARFAEITRKNLKDCGLSDWATVVVAPLEPAGVDVALDWYSSAGYAALKDIDLLVIDGPPSKPNELARYPAIPEMIERLTEDAAIFLDDANRSGEQKIISSWLEDERLILNRTIDLEKGGAEIRFRKNSA
ncbi:MAG: class I SAM-dependent methyltransferase [Halieaceae bacterium]|uniref:class I SAM-dependent methyltransferase n=1 Tax=Haliea alexandrii TaxID=2448162 RepID=UPI000F0B3ACE|nr:class I SAM-dependent methyltransferase [Haliea alexandrii]MCR9186206.1 class I SAM-dependent methyltransferase [Halieaceae bacterium]